MLCSYCGQEIVWKNLSKTNYFRSKKRGWGYCSKECAVKGGHKKDVWTEERRKKAAETMKRTNEKYHDYISERMKTNNPMSRPEVRAKISKRLKEIGHCPKIRCGNGQGLTVPQQNLLIALSKHFEVYAEYPIPTKMKKGSGYPTCYKVDIGIPENMLAVEVDGNSHCAIERQQQDKKKDSFLNGLGWTVLRFKNKQVTEHLEDCVQTVLFTISK